MKASAFRRWPVAGAYSPEQITRLTGGSDKIYKIWKIYIDIHYKNVIIRINIDDWSTSCILLEWCVVLS